MNSKYDKYQSMQLGVEVQVCCPVCKGEDKDCFRCDGKGYIIDNLNLCGHCNRTVPNGDLAWVYDRYGIAFKKVCDECYEETSNEIESWEFDESYAGERLEGDY